MKLSEMVLETRAVEEVDYLNWFLAAVVAEGKAHTHTRYNEENMPHAKSDFFSPFYILLISILLSQRNYRVCFWLYG